MCFVSAGLLMAVIPGLLLLYVFSGLADATFVVVGSLLLVAPFVLNTAIMVVIASIVTHKLRRRLPAMHTKSRRRALHARRWIWALTACWFLYLATVAYALAASAGAPAYAALVYGSVLVVCRAGVALGILALVDGHRRGRWACCGGRPASADSSATQTTASTRRDSSVASTSSRPATPTAPD
jgi:hypothetical protein